MEISIRLRPENVVKALSYFTFFFTAVSLLFLEERHFVLISSALVTFSIYIERKGIYPPKFVLNILLIPVLSFIFWSLNMENVVQKSKDALLILTAIKFLEEKKVRDYMEIYVLILFLFACRALLSFDLSFLIQVLIVFFLMSVSIVFLTFNREAPLVYLEAQEVKKIFISATAIFFSSVFLSSILFFMLPRTEYPILQFLTKQKKAKTGLSSSITLGETETVVEDYSTAFRVKMEKIGEEDLYWRFCVLDHFDGEKWERKNKRPLKSIKRPKGHLIKQTFLFEGDKPHYILALGKPIYFLSENVKPFDDYSFLRLDYTLKSQRYEVISELTDTIEEENVDERYYKQIPDNVPERIKLLAEMVIKKSGSDIEKVKKVYDMLTNGDYSYSLEELPTGKGAIEKFLFETKRGNCEFFSSAFVLILRLSGVPSRIVTGFKGGEYNQIGKYYLVRQRNAHTWAEVYIKGRGWVRFDPTPPESHNKDKKNVKALFLKASLMFDLLNYYWTNLFINYDLQRQISFFSSIGQKVDRKKISGFLNRRALLFTLLGFAICGALISSSLRIYKRFSLPPEKRVINAFLKKMEKFGYTRKETEGLVEFAQRIREEQIRTKALRLINELQKTIYRDLSLSREKEKEILDGIKKI